MSLGLAPQLVEEIFAIVARLNTEENVGFLVAERNTNIALRYADYGCRGAVKHRPVISTFWRRKAHKSHLWLVIAE